MTKQSALTLGVSSERAIVARTSYRQPIAHLGPPGAGLGPIICRLPPKPIPAPARF
jgi:hypothetical protein